MLKTAAGPLLTKWLLAFCLVAAILYFYAFLYVYAYNIPFADDILDILAFLTNVSQSQQWSQTAELFFSQLNEHRTLSSRLIYYLAYAVEGEVNFRTLVLLGNLALPLLLIIYFLAIRQYPQPLMILLPAAFILFQLRIYGTIFWSMNAFAFMFSFVYAFACLLCLRKLSPKRLMLAVVFASLATFTMASGQLIWLVGLLSLLHRTVYLRSGSRAYCVVWLVSAVTVLALFRIDYVQLISTPLMLISFLDTPFRTIYLFLAMLGGAVSDHNPILAACFGSTLLLIVSVLTVCGFRRKDIFLELSAWYIIISTGTVALARATTSAILGLSIREEGAFVSTAFADRYVILSVLLLATTVVLLLSRIPRGRGQFKINVGMIILAFVYCVSSYGARSESLQVSLNRVVGSHNRQDYWSFADVEKTSNVLVAKAVSSGVYNPPIRPLQKPVVSPLLSLQDLQSPPGGAGTD
jgi:hypothetical protein